VDLNISICKDCKENMKISKVLQTQKHEGLIEDQNHID